MPESAARLAPSEPGRQLAAARRAFDMGDWETAESLARHLLKHDPRNVNALIVLGRTAVHIDRFDEADAVFRKCLKHAPRQATVHFFMAELSLRRGRADAALARLDKAIRLDPELDTAVIEKAATLERMGRRDAARRTVDGLAVRSENKGALARVRCALELHDDRPEEAIRLADEIIHDERVDAESRARVAFIRGRAFDRLGDADRAMESWHLGNRLLRPPFDRDVYRAQVDRTIEFFSRDRLNTLAHSRCDSTLPVFIAGLPRSGTTLIEQIIDAHPNAAGAGEIAAIEMMLHHLPRTLDTLTEAPECLDQLTPGKADELAAAYLDQLAKRIPRGAHRAVNKSLQNYKHLGFIALLLPKARIILSQRDLIDAGLSIYMSPMHPAAHPYAWDLGEIGFACRQAERLMRHWRNVLDLPMLDVQYEDLIADHEAQARRIIEFLDLPWDDRCLRHHESGRTVMTLSYHQVAQPIYSSAAGRHRRYDKHLQPLREALEAED